MKKLTKKIKRWNSIVCTGLLCKTNLKRDIIIITLAMLLAGFIIGGDRYFYTKKIQTSKTSVQPEAKANDTTNNIDTTKNIDTTNWKTYEDSRYDFKIKYPDSWAKPQSQVINNTDYAYQYQVKFGTTDSLSGNGNEGFSVFISKKTASSIKGDCIFGQSQGSSNSSSSKQAGSDSQCLLYKLKVPGVSSDYYSYQFIGNSFEYNLLPTLTLSDSSQLSMGNIPEFDFAADTFILDFETINKKIAEQLKKQEAAARIARINAQYPAPTRGTPVCPDIHAKPAYSATKSKHIDEDCCPDPDEWPNLRCRYKASDYKVMLKGSPSQKIPK